MMTARQRLPVARTMLAVAAVAFGLILIQGCAQDGHDDSEHGQHGAGEPFTEPQSYAAAVNVIHAQLEKIERLIAARQLDKVHAEAAIIRDVAETMAQLALKTDSGVPREAVKEINLTATDLAAKFGPIDEAGDSGDLAGTQRVYDEMVALFETLEKHVGPESGHADDDDHDDDDDDHDDDDDD